MSYKVCLRKIIFSLLLALPTPLALLWALLLPQGDLQHRGNRPHEGNASLCSSQEATAAMAGVSPTSGVCVPGPKPSCSARALVLSLARLVTYTQTPPDLEVGTLHLTPTYDPVPVLDYFCESLISIPSFQPPQQSSSMRTRVEQTPIAIWC